MNPGLVVKLRPAGPWRIGPDSGARNRVDSVYHSDSLFSAVTSAMARLGAAGEWLEATAGAGASAVSFGSCFPFVDQIELVPPPRTAWPPPAPGAASARVRWKSARFVPLEVVRAILARRRLDENQWSVDGPSQCLVPAGCPGPFRTAVRWSAAVDRLSGAAERHSTACLEFRPGAGLWTVVSFLDNAARDRWMEPVKACFRLLADSGFGGERSRGWGRAHAPEFCEGTLPELILPAEPETATAEVRDSHRELALEVIARPAEQPAAEAAAPAEAPVNPPAPEPAGPAAAEVPASGADTPGVPAEEPLDGEPPISEPPAPEAPVNEPPAPQPEPADTAPPEAAASEENSSASGTSEMPVEEPPVIEPPAAESPVAEWPRPQAAAGPRYWLLSLFAPVPSDSIDWDHGSYTILERGGRVESPVRSGELKKQLRMVAEGSVVCAAAEPRGSAPDVAPDGFPHPVFRAGFAVAIRLPEVN